MSREYRRMNDYIESYKLLANAIIYQAAYDWKTANQEINKTATGSDTWYRWHLIRKQCETFFRSGWCGKLTKLDGNYILERLKKENNK